MARSWPEYLQILRHLLVESLREIDTPPVIAVDPWDLALAHQALAGLDNDGQLEATLTTWGGVEVRTVDGRIIVRNTLESRLARAEPFLRALVAAVWAGVEVGHQPERAEAEAIATCSP
jgi:vacuolar-type H+-ATPase subunit E/Vma4